MLSFVYARSVHPSMLRQDNVCVLQEATKRRSHDPIQRPLLRSKLRPLPQQRDRSTKPGDPRSEAEELRLCSRSSKPLTLRPTSRLCQSQPTSKKQSESPAQLRAVVADSIGLLRFCKSGFKLRPLTKTEEQGLLAHKGVRAQSSFKSSSTTKLEQTSPLYTMNEERRVFGCPSAAGGGIHSSRKHLFGRRKQGKRVPLPSMSYIAHGRRCPRMRLCFCFAACHSLTHSPLLIGSGK